MNTLPFERDVDFAFIVAFSKTLRLFHGTVVAAIVTVMVVLAITA